MTEGIEYIKNKDDHKGLEMLHTNEIFHIATGKLGEWQRGVELLGHKWTAKSGFKTTLSTGAKVGMDVVVSTPKGYEVDPVIFAKVQDAANETGATISLCTDPKEAVKDADVIYTDVWASMGFEAEQHEREQALKAYQVNEELVP